MLIAEARMGLFSTEHPERNFNFLFKYNLQEVNGSRASIGFSFAPQVKKEEASRSKYHNPQFHLIKNVQHEKDHPFTAFFSVPSTSGLILHNYLALLSMNFSRKVKGL